MGKRDFLWLVVLALLWGPAFLFVKVAVHDVPPLTLAATRVSVGGALLYTVLRFQKRNLPQVGSVWKHFAIVGLTLNALPYAFLSWGEQYIDSALASILIGADPLFTVLLAHFFTFDDRLSPSKAVGVLMGFAGVVALVAPVLFDGVQATIWGLLAVIGAAASYGGGAVYAQHKLRGLPPLVGPTAQLLTAAIGLLPLSVVVEHPYTMPVPSGPAIGSVLALAVVCTALTYAIFYRLMERTNASNLSMVAYMVPVVGVVLGVVVLGEEPGWTAYLGCALILLGIMAVNGGFKSMGWRPNQTSTQPHSGRTQLTNLYFGRSQDTNGEIYWLRQLIDDGRVDEGMRCSVIASSNPKERG